MKNRYPIGRTGSQTQNHTCGVENEFKIECSIINKVEVTSIDRRKIIGKPVVYTSINCNRIVGNANSFYKNDFRPYELFSENGVDNIKTTKTLKQVFNQKNMTLVHETSDAKFVQEFLTNPVSDNSNLVAKLLAQRIETEISKQFIMDSNQGELLRVTFLELFDIMVRESERLNDELKSRSLSSVQLFQEDIPSKKTYDPVSSVFLHSLIYRKNLWWINLKSREVTANKNGINYEGRQYLPIEDRDVFLLRKLVNEKILATVTIYPSSRNPQTLFWVHDKRMIRIRERIRRSGFGTFEKIEITKSKF